MSFLVLQSSYVEKRAGCFTLIVFLMSCDCKFSVAFPHGWVGLPFDCGISWSYSLFLALNLIRMTPCFY